MKDQHPCFGAVGAMIKFGPLITCYHFLCDVSGGVLLFNIQNHVCFLEVSLCIYVKYRMRHREGRSFEDVCGSCSLKCSWLSQCFWRIAFKDKKCNLVSGIVIASWQ